MIALYLISSSFFFSGGDGSTRGWGVCTVNVSESVCWSSAETCRGALRTSWTWNWTLICLQGEICFGCAECVCNQGMKEAERERERERETKWKARRRGVEKGRRGDVELDSEQVRAIFSEGGEGNSELRRKKVREERCQMRHYCISLLMQRWWRLGQFCVWWRPAVCSTGSFGTIYPTTKQSEVLLFKKRKVPCLVTSHLPWFTLMPAHFLTSRLTLFTSLAKSHQLIVSHRCTRQTRKSSSRTVLDSQLWHWGS